MNRIPILTLRHTQVSISWRREQPLLDESTEGGALLPTLGSSCLKFQREESHWCLLDLSGLHIHKGMEKMDMARCPICSNLILPLSLSSTLSLSVCLTPPPSTNPHPQGARRGLHSRRWGWQTAGLVESDCCQSLHVSTVHYQVATKWRSHEQWCLFVTQVWSFG